MDKTVQRATSARTRGSFNVYKLQAAACIASSAAVSIGFIYWAIRALS
jgi:hypothetical protein